MLLDGQFSEYLRRFLPPDFALDFENSETLRAASQHLNSLERALVSFLPQYIAEGNLRLEERYGDLKPGALLFADVSGFTALSEQLQHAGGVEGVETLTEIINDYFATMLEVLAKADGQLLKFAGDALLAFFPGELTDLRPARAAIRTGLRMQRLMRDKFQPVQTSSLAKLLGASHGAKLTMSIGIARGELFEALVGNAQQRDHIIQGALPGDAMRAESAGERDEVVITGELAAALQAEGTFRVKPLDEDHYQVIDDLGDQLDDYELVPMLRRRGISAALSFDMDDLTQRLRAQVERIQVVARYVAPTVLNALIASADQHLTSENRFTTTMFVHSTGFAEMLAARGSNHVRTVTKLLERFYNIIQRIVSSTGGTLARTDPFALGIKLLIIYGAPVAHSDDPDRAVGAALEMLSQVRKFNERLREELPAELHRETFVSLRIGITQGETYAGEVGWKQRREFTVMGDEVNLAARLMSKAEFGQVLISERLREQLRGSYQIEILPALQLKGKREPVRVYQVEAVAETALTADFGSETSFVGHDMFLLTLSYSLAQARNGRLRALAIVGDSGTGKTRIAQKFASAAQAAGFYVAWAGRYSINAATTTWASLIAQLVGIVPAASLSERRERLAAVLASLGIAELEMPLSELLGLPVRERIDKAQAQSQYLADLFAKFSQMSPEEQRSSGMFGVMRRWVEASPANEGNESALWKTAKQRTDLREAISRFLLAYTAEKPAVLIIDDLRQENVQAIDFLRYLIAETKQAKLVILLTFEPQETIDLAVQKFIIPDLNRDETNLVAMAVLHVAEIGPRLGELLWQRTGGRPLFIESLLRLLLARDYITINGDYAELREDADLEALPENIRKLIISRIDRMSGLAQSLVRSAAVLGTEFTIAALAAVNDFDDLASLQPAIDELVQANVLKTSDGEYFAFAHGLTQSVVYETLARSQRLKLHQAAADYWQRQPVSNARCYMLAYHLHRCGLTERAVEVVKEAAEAAEAQHDLDGAIDLYAQALNLFPGEQNIRTQIARLTQIAEQLRSEP
ncbi:MAG: adenylate/guanylate cyclase domain-containing protein [Aggregatilineales bacterium]